MAFCFIPLLQLWASSATAESEVVKNPQIESKAPTQFSAARDRRPSTSRSCLPPALKEILASIENRFGSMRIVSTYRPGARIAGTNHASLHASCRAVDFHPAPGKYREVLAYVRANWSGGIGIYSGQQHHLHLDVGFKKVWHTRVASPSLGGNHRPGLRGLANQYSLMNNH
jgi:uncharacterized protein YcbK (DUF882 family)